MNDWEELRGLPRRNEPRIVVREGGDSDSMFVVLWSKGKKEV